MTTLAEPYPQLGRSFRVIEGDALTALRDFPENHFDACLCDPPYGLTADKKGGSGVPSVNLDSPYGRARIGTGNGPGGFMGMKWDAGVPDVDVWREALRVLKPGAPLLAFGGARTHHRLMCAIEDAGFEIRDCLMWLYGSGFPKSLDISKALDKRAGEYCPGDPLPSSRTTPASATGIATAFRIKTASNPQTPEAALWNGYGTALKPAWEPIVLAMKPCDGTFAENALKWGVSGLAIDACKIGTGDDRAAGGKGSASTPFLAPANPTRYDRPNGGRWPANVLLDEASAAMLDEQSGECSAGARPAVRNVSHFGGGNGTNDGERIELDSGGASRFFYIAKADNSERHAAGKNTHPTVKPVDLAAYLAKLLLPPKRDTPRRIVVPFCGSGSEIMGALRAGWDEAVGIESHAPYAELARRRITNDAPLLNMEATA